MPDLPPTLHEEIVSLLSPRREFRLPNGRIADLDPLLHDWPGRLHLNWDAAVYEFFNSFVQAVPGDQLKRVLQKAVVGGERDEARVADLCYQIDAALATPESEAPPSPLAAYYEAVKEELAAG